MRMNLPERWEAIWLQLSARGWRRPEPSVKPMDYRDRISVITWLLVFGLGLSLLYSLPGMIFTFEALGSPISIPLTETSLAAVFLSLLAAVGADSVVSLHPRFVTPTRRQDWKWTYWALPMALTIISVFVLPLAPQGLIQVLALLFSGALLTLAYFCLYATVERGQAGFRRARFVLDALAYGSALVLFLFVYQTRTRSLLSGTLVAMTAILLAVEMLRTTVGRPRLVLSYSAIVGLILGQVTWALNYWLLPGLTGGLILLLIFYVLVGVAQQGLQDRLNRRVLLEFAIFALVALLLIGLVGPGFG